MGAEFERDGRPYVACNGGPHFRLNAAFSLAVDCATQEEVDRYWDALTAAGGEPSRCGWLNDRFGMSWQVIPSHFISMMSDPAPTRATGVTQAMMTMCKRDMAALQRAYRGA